jgi:hypothetical protein
MNVDIIKVEYMMNMIKWTNVKKYDLEMIIFIVTKDILEDLFDIDGPYSSERPWQPRYQQVGKPK